MSVESKTIKSIKFYTFLLILAYFLIPFNFSVINHHQSEQSFIINWACGFYRAQLYINNETIHITSFFLDIPFVFGFAVIIIAILTLINTNFYKHLKLSEIISSKLIDCGVILILISLMFLFISLGSYLYLYDTYSDNFDSGIFLPLFSIVVFMIGIFYFIIGVKNSQKLDHKKNNLEKEEPKEFYEKKAKRRRIIILIKIIFFIFYFLGVATGIPVLISIFIE
ncbi:MAG: hypothetical protein ACFFDH_12190 [Promethearchaeota archaeon]